jgi:hypothetical protein
MKSSNPKIPMQDEKDHLVTRPIPEHFAPDMKVPPDVVKRHGLVMFQASPYASDHPVKLKLLE